MFQMKNTFKRDKYQYNGWKVEIGSAAYKEEDIKNIYYTVVGCYVSTNDEDNNRDYKLEHDAFLKKLKELIKHWIYPTFEYQYILDFKLPHTGERKSNRMYISFELTMIHNKQQYKPFKAVVEETKPIVNNIIDGFEITLLQNNYSLS